MEILCVGRLKERYWTEAVAEYTKRLQSFCKLRITEIPECRVGDRPTGGEIEKVLETEGNAILQKISPSAYVIPMCIEGKSLSSKKLAETLQNVACLLYTSGCYGIGFPGVSWNWSREINCAARLSSAQ